MNKVINNIENYYIEYLLVAFIIKIIALGNIGFAEAAVFGIMFAYKGYNQFLSHRLINDKQEIFEELAKTNQLVLNKSTENHEHIKEEIDKLRGALSTMKINLGMNHKPSVSPFEPKQGMKTSDGKDTKGDQKRYF